MPSIFVAPNDGQPANGRWIDLDDLTVVDGLVYMDDDHDLENPIGGHITDYDDGLSTWEHVRFVVEGRDDHGLDVDVMIAWLDNHDDFDHDRCEEAYCGQWESDEDFAMQYFDDCIEVPPSLRCYIDKAAWTRDFMMDHFESSGHYFRSL